MTEHRLLELLQKNNIKIATAESCTGGLVAALLCDIAGISAWSGEKVKTALSRRKSYYRLRII